MTEKQLPLAPGGRPRVPVAWELRPSVMGYWHSELRAVADSDTTISILDVIGRDYWGEGVSAKHIARALGAMNGAEVTVHINSPGGDLFEGLAIYNLLRGYEGRVTVQVLGIAASAASLIAMAGDDIQIGRGAFLMIHNCWAQALGNRHDFAELAASLEPFDKAMVDIYAARSGLDRATVGQMMDAESYLGGSDAVEKGLADGLLPADAICDGENTPGAALRKIDALLAQTSLPGTQRRQLLNVLRESTPGAVTRTESMPCASEIEEETKTRLQAALNGLIQACR